MVASLIIGLAAGRLANWAADTLPQRRAGGDTGVADGAKVRQRGPLLYAAMVAAFVATAWLLGPDPVRVAIGWLYAAFLLTVLVIDFEHRRVLNIMLGPAAVVVVALSLLPQTPTLQSSLVGGAVGLGLFMLVYLLSRGHLGMGDVKLAGLIGLMLGYPAVINCPGGGNYPWRGGGDRAAGFQACDAQVHHGVCSVPGAGRPVCHVAVLVIKENTCDVAISHLCRQIAAPIAFDHGHAVLGRDVPARLHASAGSCKWQALCRCCLCCSRSRSSSLRCCTGRRRAHLRHGRDILLAWGGTLLPLAMQPNGSSPNAIGSLLVLMGVVLATGAVLSLGRSFGIEAANRGIQTHGLYRFVRHPIYAAYLPLMGGYLVAYPSWWNALAVCGVDGLPGGACPARGGRAGRGCAVPSLCSTSTLAADSGRLVIWIFRIGRCAGYSLRTTSSRSRCSEKSLLTWWPPCTPWRTGHRPPCIGGRRSWRPPG